MPKSSERDGALLLRCSDVSKEFYIYEHRTRSLREWFVRTILRKPVHIGHPHFALSHINLELRRGDSLAVVGQNGAGKSTLLRLLAGIYGPTSGRIEVHGRIGSVIELGAGFHDELTGAENAALYGATFGLNRMEIAERYERILEFSGVGEFIDTPVKYYSSGMRARLAFSVVTCIQPDILLLDEVLAVGDTGFREKCIGWLHSFRESGGALVMSSHDTDLLLQLCDRAIGLEAGSLRCNGPVNEVVLAYNSVPRWSVGS